MDKRVWALYRVSTKGQVDSDEDIPVQKNACRKLIANTDDWELTHELYERGVSGWKKSMDDRDALIEIREGAINKEFDVLLVFMYDRLARKEDEAPLVVEFLHQHGIEVHSVKEGKMNSGQHIDKLMNYITFWQSSGESLKTSIRVKESLQHLNEKGYYVGGSVPYGYDLVETDERHPKKDKPLKRLAINKEQASVVEIIFDLAANKNYGRNKIALYLNERGYKNAQGKKFSDKLVYRILNNPVYIGRKRYDFFHSNSNDKFNMDNFEGKLQPYNADLQIISEDLFKDAHEMMERRRQKPKDDNTKLRGDAPTNSQVLLSGLITCGYCGGKMKTDYSYKDYKRKSDGKTTRMVTYRYRCTNGNHGIIPHEKRQVGSKTIDKLVEEYVIGFMENIDINKLKKTVKAFKSGEVDSRNKEVEQLKKELEKKYKSLNTLNEEVPKALVGESSFTPEILSKSITTVEAAIKELNEKIKKHKVDLSSSEQNEIELKRFIKVVEGWVEKYKSKNLEERKVMLSYVVNSVVWKKDDLVVNVDPVKKNSLYEDYLCIESTLSNGTVPSAHRYMQAFQYVKTLTIAN